MYLSGLLLHTTAALSLLSQYWLVCTCFNPLTSVSGCVIFLLDENGMVMSPISDAASCDHWKLGVLDVHLHLHGNDKDPNAIYQEKRGDLNTLDKAMFWFWKGLFAIGRVVGMRGWRVFAGIGEAMFEMSDRYGESWLGRRRRDPKRDDYYMYGEYEEEFDIGMDVASLAFMEKERTSHRYRDRDDDNGRRPLSDFIKGRFAKGSWSPPKEVAAVVD